MGFRIGQAESRAPRNPQNGPALEAVQAAQSFDVGQEMRGRVAGEVGAGLARQGAASPRPALVEQDDPVRVRIKVAARTRGEADPGPAVKVESRQASRISAALPVHPVPITRVEIAAVVRLDGRESAW